MKNALSLAPRLAAARLKGGRGGAVLDVFAVIAFTVATVLALTVAGGTWMFLDWNWNGNPELLTNLGLPNDEATQSFIEIYVLLAALACALLLAGCAASTPSPPTGPVPTSASPSLSGSPVARPAITRTPGMAFDLQAHRGGMG